MNKLIEWLKAPPGCLHEATIDWSPGLGFYLLLKCVDSAEKIVNDHAAAIGHDFDKLVEETTKRIHHED